MSTPTVTHWINPQGLPLPDPVSQPLLDLSQLDERISQYMIAEQQVQAVERKNHPVYAPSEPRAPKAADHWEAVGREVGMDGAEVGIIMENVLRDPTNAMIIDAVRHLLMMGKLHAGDLIGEYRAKRTEERQRYEKALATYHANVARLEENKAKLDAMRGQRDSLYSDLWKRIVDELCAYCEIADHKFNRMHPTAQAAMTVMDRHSKYVVFDRTDPNDLRLTVNWPQIYKFKGPHINTILGLFNQMRVFKQCGT